MIEELAPKQYMLWLTDKIAHVKVLVADAVKTGSCGGSVLPGS